MILLYSGDKDSADNKGVKDLQLAIRQTLKACEKKVKDVKEKARKEATTTIVQYLEATPLALGSFVSWCSAAEGGPPSPLCSLLEVLGEPGSRDAEHPASSSVVLPLL